MNPSKLRWGILNTPQIAPKNWSAVWLTGHVASILTRIVACSSFAQEAQLGTNCVVSFATVEAAKNILTNRDDFIAALSSFDRAARMKTNREVAEKEFLEFLGRSVLV